MALPIFSFPLLLLSLSFSFFFLFSNVDGAEIVLDLNKANDKCQQESEPCLFSTSPIWFGNNNPTTGDTVTMIADANMNTNITLYIHLVLGIQLNTVQISGPINFVVYLQGEVSIAQLTVDNNCEMEVHDATVTAVSASFTGNALLTLSGQANFTAQSLYNYDSNILLVDSAVLQGANFNIGSINSSSTSSLYIDNLVLIDDDDALSQVVIDGFAQVTNLTAINCLPNINNGVYGSIYATDGANIYFSNNITVGNITMDKNAQLVVLMNSNFVSGAINGQGNIDVIDAVITIGDVNTPSNFQSIFVDISGNISATFTNVQFSTLEIFYDYSNSENASLILNDVTFGSSMSVPCAIQANGLTILDKVSIDGTVSSTGYLSIMGQGLLNASVFTQTGASALLFGPLISPSISIENCFVYATDEMIGTVTLVNTSVAVSQHVVINGSLSVQNCILTVTDSSALSVLDGVFSTGYTYLSGHVLTPTLYQEFGSLYLQGKINTGLITLTNTSLVIQNATSIFSAGGILLQGGNIILLASLYINGSAIIDSYHITGNPSQSLTVNGSVYSSGASSISSVTVNANSFTHVQDSLTLEGNLGGLISFASASVFATSPSTLYGNISLTATMLFVSSPLTIEGILFVRKSTITSQSSNQTLLVTQEIQGNDDANFNNSVIVSTPLYTQISGTVNVGGRFEAAKIIISPSTILALTYPSVIIGNVTAQGGILELHAASTINGSLNLDPHSELMIYNNNENIGGSTLSVNGLLNISGNLVYWFTPLATRTEDVTYNVVYYNGTLMGKFATHDAYGPNFQLIQLKLHYGHKVIQLIYSKSEQPSKNVGKLIGIVIGVAGFLIIVTFAIVFYKKYSHNRSKYDPINEMTEQPNYDE